MVGGARKPWLMLATWIWWSAFIMGVATWFFSTAAAAAGEDGNAGPVPLLIKPVVGFENVGDGLSTNSEATGCIVGFSDLCAEVSDGDYHKGKCVRMWRCRSDNDARQLWTVMNDGTIRSKGIWCLTTHGYTPRDCVMIYPCNCAVPEATIWQIWGNGTIVNPKSKLAMTGHGFGMNLTVEENIYSPGQGWMATNVTAPTVVSIMGFNNLCMGAHGTQVWVETCSPVNTRQKWAFYADGSIRPNETRDQCLTCEKDVRSTVITIDSCSSGWSGQRWVFTEEGSILNLGNWLVMDVAQSNPALRKIIIYPSTGKPNQKWRKVFS